jgi:hypothetical protein
VLLEAPTVNGKGLQKAFVLAKQERARNKERTEGWVCVIGKNLKSELSSGS